MSAEEDRQAFREHVLESERLAAADDVEAANRQTEALGRITGPWEQGGQLAELLRPLLADDEPRSVRFNAASFLLHRGFPEEAIPTLEEIRDGDGLESMSARVILDRWRAQGT